MNHKSVLTVGQAKQLALLVAVAGIAGCASINSSSTEREVHVQGLGVVKVDLRGDSERLRFLHNGYLYLVPNSFVTRPELHPKEKEVLFLDIRPKELVANGRSLSTVEDAIQFLKAAGPDKPALITVAHPEVVPLPQVRLEELAPLMEFVNNSSFVGARQKMPAGWDWPEESDKGIANQTLEDTRQ